MEPLGLPEMMVVCERCSGRCWQKQKNHLDENSFWVRGIMFRVTSVYKEEKKQPTLVLVVVWSSVELGLTHVHVRALR